jgi:ABC-2 type transport system ATP-binding protein
MPGMIEVDNLTKYFGQVMAVNGINFSVDRGEIVGFLGPNGAGKSTTMRILTTYLPATSGIARVAGHDVMNESLQVRQNVGYLPENVPLYPEMRVEEFLSYRAKLKGVGPKERKSRLENCLERCRIREVRRRLIATLSRGYRQRVGLADALINDPPILILDEPTAGLDPLQSRETRNTIKDLGSQHTILFSTHILPEVEEVCQRVIIIRSGQIGLDRKMSELTTDRASLVVEVRGPRDEVLKVIRETDGVEEASAHSASDGLVGCEVRCNNDQDLRELIAERIFKNGWGLRRLDLRQRKLQDLFTEVVYSGADAPLAASTAIKAGK